MNFHPEIKEHLDHLIEDGYDLQYKIDDKFTIASDIDEFPKIIIYRYRNFSNFQYNIEFYNIHSQGTFYGYYLSIDRLINFLDTLIIKLNISMLGPPILK